MQVEKYTQSLYKITLTLNEFNVNMGVFIGDDGILLIDTGWIMTAEGVKDKIRELDEGPIKLIVFTHQHGDHIGGRHILGQDATLIAHKNTRHDLAGKYYHLDPLPGQALPAILLENQININFNGEEIRIFPAPGHTSSDCIVYFIDSGVVFMGDLLFSDSFPALFTVYGGDIEKLIQTLAMLIEKFPEDIKLIAGHGRDYSLEDLREYHQMITTTSDLIKEGLAAGKDKGTMVQEQLLKDWERWSVPQITTENWIDFVCESLSDKIKRSISDPLSSTIMDEGIDAALEQYQTLKDEDPGQYNFGENELNMLGYQLLWRDINDAAIEIFKLNTRVYPESANPYDSLGEASEAIGDQEKAIKSYQKALEINPNMPSAKEALERLK